MWWWMGVDVPKGFYNIMAGACQFNENKNDVFLYLALTDSCGCTRIVNQLRTEEGHSYVLASEPWHPILGCMWISLYQDVGLATILRIEQQLIVVFRWNSIPLFHQHSSSELPSCICSYWCIPIQRRQILLADSMNNSLFLLLFFFSLTWTLNGKISEMLHQHVYIIEM